VIKNVGSAAWDPTGTACREFDFAPTNPQAAAVWIPSRVVPAAPVAPGDTAVLDFSVIATEVGAYAFQWRALQECVGFFGDPSMPTLVSVGANVH
jgi:hypothetical protein